MAKKKKGQRKKARKSKKSKVRSHKTKGKSKAINPVTTATPPKRTMLVQCNNCRRVFSSGLDIAIGVRFIIEDCRITCPYCHSIESMPDGNFQTTVEGFTKMIFEAEDPLEEARKLQRSIQNASAKDSLDELKPWREKMREWVPDSPQKLANYATIIAAIIALLSNKPEIRLEFNQTFIRQFNQIIEGRQDR